MSKLLWFDGITWDTPINDIGWTYVILILLAIVLTWGGLSLIKDSRR